MNLGMGGTQSRTWLKRLSSSRASGPGNEKECVAAWRGRRQHSWAHRWHSHRAPFHNRLWGWTGLTVLPCSLSCSHLSQMLQISHTSVKSSSFQSLLKLRHEALPDTPTPWRSWWILSCPAVAFFQLLIMWCHTVMSFLYLFGVRNNWKFTEYCKNKNSS